MIRATKHSILEANTNKIAIVEELISEQRKAVQFYIDYIWTECVETLNVPNFISSVNYVKNQ